MILELGRGGGVIDDYYASLTPQGVQQRFSPDGPPSIYQPRRHEPLPPFGASRSHKSNLKACFEKKKKNFSVTPFIKMLKDCFT